MKRAFAETAFAIGLLAGVVGTGIELASSMHESRGLFQELELLRAEQDRLQDEWSAFWIEVNTIAGQSQIDEIARARLGMVEPGDRLEYVELMQ